MLNGEKEGTRRNLRRLRRQVDVKCKSQSN